jgi:hypothetical protein
VGWRGGLMVAWMLLRVAERASGKGLRHTMLRVLRRGR